ncbi:KN motif and ankyrin repeat domain-containing protein 2 kank isoform 2-T2 [Glossina fuscipes fuscipes]
MAFHQMIGQIDFKQEMWQNLNAKIKDLQPQEQAAIRNFWRSLVLRSQGVFSDSNGHLPQYANVRSCNCCPYGYHIDLDFVRYCEALANAKPSEEELQRRSRRRSRKSMEVMLGLDSLFDQWDAIDKQQTLTELPYENELPQTPEQFLQRTFSFSTSTPYQTAPTGRQRSSSVPRFPTDNAAQQHSRSASPFAAPCSSSRYTDSDVTNTSLYRFANSPPETKAFLHDALDEVCSDFERTLERASVKRKKYEDMGDGSGAFDFHTSDRNNNSFQTRDKRNGWSRGKHHHLYFHDISDSCVTGNKSPRTSQIYMKPLAFQQKLSPGEQQYESYVKAAVAANAKSPVEDILSAQNTPPAPPPRRHALSTKLVNSSPTTTTASTTESLQFPSSPSCLPDAAPTSSSSTADAQTLFNIREQMALSLRRMKDLEEQVKAIPELKCEVSQLREDKERLQQAVQRKEEELQRARELTRLSSSPSPIASPKYASPVQFQPQRISPISLESMGARLRSSTPSASVLKRDVGTMCVKKSTRDIGVGGSVMPIKSSRDVGCSASLTKNVTETLYTKIEVEERVKVSIKEHEKQRKLERFKEMVSIGTQMQPPKHISLDKSIQTKAIREIQKYNVGVMAQPNKREAFVTCKPEVRTVGSSDDRISDILCGKCRLPKRTVAVSTEDMRQENSMNTVSLKLLDTPKRSNTFCLGDNEKLNIKRKTIGTQCTPITVSSCGCQTASTIAHSVGTQYRPEMQNSSTQSYAETVSRHTDTKDLLRLNTTQTSTVEISPPTPMKEEKPEQLKRELLHKSCNTEIKQYRDYAINTSSSSKQCHSSSNTEEVHKRDIGCGDVDAIKNLAKDFSKVAISPQPSKASDSKIPRPRNLPSPSPARRTIQRQNTYTIPLTSIPSPSSATDKKIMARSLQEKSPEFNAAEVLPVESESFLKQTTSQQPNNQRAVTETQPLRDLPYDLAQASDNDLIVREETRVSISWSRDNSPAPNLHKSHEELPQSTLDKQQEEFSTSAEQISTGARKKTSLSPLQSSHHHHRHHQSSTEENKSSHNVGKSLEKVSVNEEIVENPPSKAMLQKIAMVEAEPRKKYLPSKDMLSALKTINNSLLKKLGSKPISSLSLKSSKTTIQQEWFCISSSEQANPHEVEDYLDCFEEMSVSLLEHCVNMVDVNGNTAMHYAVSHGNFDVVSILLDSKVCNVNQMNNAGYTCVMLVSLAKLKNAAHRTVVERLFQMADVNVRAKKHCQTALMLAVSHGNLEMVQLLMAAGADVNIQDEDGSTALMCAAEHGRGDIVKHLLSQTDCDSLIQDVDGSTAFKIAWQAGHREIGLLLYVHEQMLRSKLPHRGETTLNKCSPSTSPRYYHKRQPSK